MAEHFVSMVHLLDAKSTPNRHKKTVISAMRARACKNDTLTLDFARSDFLALSASEHRSILRSTRDYWSLHPEGFACRAKHASVLVVGTGHHLARACARNTKLCHEHLEHVNRSITHLAHARKNHDRRTLAVIGVRSPVFNCRNYTAPLTRPPPNTKTPFGWHMLNMLNNHLRTVARENGATFMDVYDSSALRPDATLGHAQRNADCVHTCLPGPTDSWNHLAWSTLSQGIRFRETRTMPPTEVACIAGISSATDNCVIHSSEDCPCSSGCTSRRWGLCLRSSLCDNAELPLQNGTAIAMSLVFHADYVRNKFRGNATLAYMREYRRIQHLIASLKRVQTRLPIVVMVGGQRHAEMERTLQVTVRPVPFIKPRRGRANGTGSVFRR